MNELVLKLLYDTCFPYYLVLVSTCLQLNVCVVDILQSKHIFVLLEVEVICCHNSLFYFVIFSS
jgi:hypothetical protein